MGNLASDLTVYGNCFYQDGYNLLIAKAAGFCLVSVHLTSLLNLIIEKSVLEILLSYFLSQRKYTAHISETSH